nr:hypothetical protein [candidate division Zixibacteria bacterium]
MEVLTLILPIAALVIAVLAYKRAGGMADLKQRVNQIASGVDIRKSVDALVAATDTLKEKSAEAIAKLEATVKREKREEKPPGTEPAKKPEDRRLPPTTEDFQSELDKVFATAQEEGKPFVEVKSGDLHRSVGGYPGPNHRITLC